MTAKHTVPVALDARTVPTPEGVTYVPWTDGHAVGFRCVHDDGRVEYLYLDPSSSSDDGQPNVFVYQGPHGDPNQDAPVHFYDVLDGEVAA